MADLVLDRVTKVFPGGVKAVSELCLAVRDGEFIVLVGPSGCGKSTTLRLIVGLEELTCGSVRLAGREISSVPPRHRDVALVPQNGALYPHMSVYGNLSFGLKLRRVPRAKRDRRVRSVAGLLGIENLLGRKPRQLSGGERQRVALGRALVRTPQAFLFDEPLSSLDARLRVEMRAELKGLHQKLKTTTVYVTHDQEEALTLGQRVAVMKDGAIQQCGRPLDIYCRPVNRFVAGFVGKPPMNFLHGRVLAEGGHLYFPVGSGRIRLPGRLHACLAGRVNRPMVLGVRPEGLSCSHDGVCEENRLDVVVSTVEMLGDHQQVTARTSGGDSVVCRVDADRRILDGMHLPLYLNPDQVHVFEPGDEGVNVSCGDRASATQLV